MSLRQLGVDRSDRLYLHRVDPGVPFADQIGTMKEPKNEGKIAHVGLSEASVEQIEAAGDRRRRRRRAEHLTTRTWEAVLAYCTRERIPFVAWFPAMNGALAKPGGVAAQVAADTGSTPAQVALAWLLARSAILCPIPGTSSLPHLEENVAAASLRLTGEQIARLTASSRSPTRAPVAGARACACRPSAVAPSYCGGRAAGNDLGLPSPSRAARRPHEPCRSRSAA
ncbi:aldo/keto reductase [Streptomyces sp. NBC_01724]|uniref:aldo/keto reductase n=1 Tax=unclassified Streptomyces TaxID=2593676 RepID=UPI002E374DFB|nr:aldo/keto reductase [Streptomyces sp. NBC_01724]WTE56485.1 aldo/keto reductase [Streptomyces sp. NBC_01620]WTE64557.1 aldo/keto reductase [Streptomyces sp. NBC_01617]WTI91843.1 aldo/keto reductase [Streptomyces sp. NBC_00724]